MSRNIRRIINSFEAPQTFSNGAPASSLQEGGTSISLDNGKLAVRRKHKGIVFKSFMSRDVNEIVEKKLTTNELEYKRKFVDYRVFNHNFTDDLPATKVYLHWSGPSEQTTMLEPRTGYLAPFDMICHKLIFRIDDVDTGATDIVFSINKIDETDFEKLLYTSEIPNPDLIIRTGGQQRISNFMLWQSAYSEMYFTTKLWPDFNKKDVIKALNDFKKRNRNYGNTN